MSNNYLNLKDVSQSYREYKPFSRNMYTNKINDEFNITLIPVYIPCAVPIKMNSCDSIIIEQKENKCSIFNCFKLFY